jgi:archaemetzincin
MRKIAFLALFLLLSDGVGTAMEFKPPGPAERLRAVGSTDGLSRTLRLALDPGTDFEPIPDPRPGDWLAEHRERGQTYDDFLELGPQRPDSVRNRIYLQPLGGFPEDRSPPVDVLREFASAYFAMDVVVLPSLDLRSAPITSRVNPQTRKRQILTTDVLALLRGKLPRDAFCMLGVTMEDLYPQPSWNFVFGQASLRERVGVFSFARYDPAFYGEERQEKDKHILLERSCRVLAHETGHMFSLQHCVFFRCVLNGSNHLQESDSRPLALCPVCLRKLQHCIGFDVTERYHRLLRFYQKAGFHEEALWVSGRLKRISDDGGR